MIIRYLLVVELSMNYMSFGTHLTKWLVGQEGLIFHIFALYVSTCMYEGIYSIKPSLNE